MTSRQAITHWSIGVVKKIVPVHIGIFNETYRVQTKNGDFILQKLHSLISGPGPTANYAAIMKFLRSKNYTAQEVVRTKRGTLLTKDGKQSWRLLKEVPGKVYARAPNATVVREAGKGLGTVHKLLKSFRGGIRNPLPMFRYVSVLKKLRAHRIVLLRDKKPEVREAATFLLEHLPRYFLPATLSKRIIHTDPKISNFIFDQRNRIVAMIDFDTVQRLSPLYDLGDALRSLCGKAEDDPKNRFDFVRYRAFLRGYFQTSRDYLNRKERALIPQATALVILGLASRFLNDYIDDNYFGWNPKKYKSHKAHNLARCLGQIALYKSFSNM